MGAILTVPEGIMKRQGSQLRKYLFYGLTLILATVFVFLTIQGRRMEKERMQKGTENVQKFDPTPIRVLAPEDIEITAASMILKPGSEAEKLLVARHNIEIRNTGHVSYCAIQLKLDYVDAAGKVIASLPHTIKRSILPGERLPLSELIMENIPAEAIDCRPSIIYADIEPAEGEK